MRLLGKIIYKTKKWDKEIIQINKVRKKLKENYGLSSTEQLNINSYLVNYRKYKATQIESSDDYFDFISLYSQMGMQYYLASGKSWLLYSDIDSCIGNLYLFILSMKKAYDLQKDGKITRNPAVENAMDGDEIYLIAHSAMAIHQFSLWSNYSPKIKILTAFYQENLELARKFVEQLPDNVEDDREVYFYDDKFLKKIYLSILDKDESRFNDELLNRVKKLRKNPVGYLTYVDVVSISLINLAKKQGLNYNFDVIEIPKYFLSDDLKIDKDKYLLPDIY